MSDARITELIDRAFAYRGYVTLSLRDGTQRVGFVYDRGAGHVEMFDEAAEHRWRMPLDEIADVAITGEDIAEHARVHWERHERARPHETREDAEEAPTVIVVALPIELRGIARALGARVHGDRARSWLGGPLIARAVGIGGSAARTIAAEHPRLVISCGFAGALHPTLAVGDFVVASSVRDESGDVVTARAAVVDVARRVLDGRTPVAVGEIVSATRVAATRDEKRALAMPGRIAVDLESWGVARAAETAGIPWLALRVVLDPLDSDLPAFTRDPDGGSPAAMLRHALRGPRAVRELVHLALSADKAIRSMQRALWRLAPVLDELGAARDRG